MTDREDLAAENRALRARIAELERRADLADLGAGADAEHARLAADATRARDLFKVIFDNAAVGIAATDVTGRVTMVNDAFCAMLGYAADELRSMSFADFTHPEDLERERVYFDDVLEGRRVHYHMEKRYRTRAGTDLWIDIFVSTIRGAAGDIESFVGVVADISARKQAERVLRASLLEKETLLREVHHRVKNNFQIISSLVALQSREVSDPRQRDAFDKARDRVRAMAIVHEHLYQSASFSEIDFGAHLKALVGMVVHAPHGHAPIGIRCDVESIPLELDVAIPLGLIAHELVTNALKHAHGPDKGGTIVVRCRARGDDVVLAVADDGRGLPPGFEPRTVRSLGYRLVRELVAQLGGGLAFEAGSGTTVVVTVPRTTPR